MKMPKGRKLTKCILFLAGVVVFGVALCMGLHLLYASKLSGSEFVAFVIAFALIGLIIAFASEVQEFSVAGNVVKLREFTHDAEKVLDNLKDIQAELLRLMLLNCREVPNGYAHDYKSNAINQHFWYVVEKARVAGVIPLIKPELISCVEVIMFNLYNHIRGFAHSCECDPFSKDYSLAEISAKFLNPAFITEGAKQNDSKSEEWFRNYINARMLELETLFVLQREIATE